MEVKLSIILETLSAFNPVTVNCQDTKKGFPELRFLSECDESLSADTLYVATPEVVSRYCGSRPEHLPGASITVVCPCAADSRNIPLSSALGFIFVDCVVGIGGVFNALQEVFDQYHRIELAFDKAIYADRTIKSVIDVGNTMLDYMILIWDANFNIIASSDRYSVSSPLVNTIIERKFFTSEIVRGIVANDLLATPEYENTTRVLPKEKTYSGATYYIRHYFRRNQRFYSAGLVSEVSDLTEAELDRLEIFFSKLEKLLAISVPDDDYGNVFGNFLISLIDGSLTKEWEIIERASAFGLNVASSYIFYVIEFKQFSVSKARLLINSLNTVLPLELMVIHEDRICMLKNVNAHRCTTPEARAGFQNLLASYDAFCGLSREMKTITNCRTAYQQSLIALCFGRKTRAGGESQTDRIFAYRNHATHHLLMCFKNSAQDLWSLLPAKFVALYNDSKSVDNSDLQFLITFVNNSMSTTETAKALMIHRNTVINRIARIKEKYRIDLEDPDSLFRFLLLMNIVEYEDSYSSC